MTKTTLPKDRGVYLWLGLLFVVLLLVMPRSGKFNYDYRKGSLWTHDNLVAQFDFPILKTAEEIQSERDAAGSGVIPYYRYSEEKGQQVLRGAEGLPMDEALKSRVLSALSDIYDRGVLLDDAVQGGRNSDPVLYVQRAKRAARTVASNLYTVSAAKAKIHAEANGAYSGTNLDSLLSAAGVYQLIVPNLEYDKETTNLIHAQSADYISPTQGYVSAGQQIVSKGELVTAEVQKMLDSYKAEYEQMLGYGGPRILLWLGNAMIALALVLILFLSICYTNPKIFEDTHRFLYLLFIFLLATISALLTDRFVPNLLYLLPFSLIALYQLAFFRKRVVLPVYILSLLPLLIFAHHGIELFVIHLIAGVVTILVFDHFNKGWKQFLTSLIVFAAMLLVFIGFRLLSNSMTLADLRKVLFLLIGSLLPVAGYPLIFLFEKMFGLVSNSRLIDLSDTGTPLLTELQQKAPGTFQHSLQVMNMAEAVARSIDANEHLTRAGALYHDIGKLANPQCFVENEAMGSHFHEGLTPQESAREILRHVPDGMALAKKYGLPQIVADFILTHHGTSCTGYFYNKFINDGGNPEDKAAFTYSGRKPVSKEQCIVMLCDGIEAASRTLKDNKPETFSAFVERMVQSKIDEGQLDESELSLKELGTVKTVLKNYLSQLYHDRIAYPKRNK